MPFNPTVNYVSQQTLKESFPAFHCCFIADAHPKATAKALPLPAINYDSKAVCYGRLRRNAEVESIALQNAFVDNLNAHVIFHTRRYFNSL